MAVAAEVIEVVGDGRLVTDMKGLI